MQEILYFKGWNCLNTQYKFIYSLIYVYIYLSVHLFLLISLLLIERLDNGKIEIMCCLKTKVFANSKRKRIILHSMFWFAEKQKKAKSLQAKKVCINRKKNIVNQLLICWMCHLSMKYIVNNWRGFVPNWSCCCWWWWRFACVECTAVWISFLVNSF